MNGYRIDEFIHFYYSTTKKENYETGQRDASDYAPEAYKLATTCGDDERTDEQTDGRTASCRVRVGVRCSGLEALSDALIYVQ